MLLCLWHLDDRRVVAIVKRYKLSSFADRFSLLPSRGASSSAGGPGEDGGVTRLMVVCEVVIVFFAVFFGITSCQTLCVTQKMNKQLLAPPSLVPSTRFAHTRTWTIDVNDYGQKFYHVVSSTPKSFLVQRGTLFSGSLHVEGNALLDSICTAQSNGIDRVGNTSTVPDNISLNAQTRFGARRLLRCRIGHRDAAGLPQPGDILQYVGCQCDWAQQL